MNWPSRTEHQRRLRQLKCVVSSMTPVTLHHCHGGSMLERWDNPGVGQRQNPALQIPLHAEYHVGSHGIDHGMGPVGNVRAWEAAYGTQAEHLDTVSRLLGYDVWALAKHYAG